MLAEKASKPMMRRLTVTIFLMKKGGENFLSLPDCSKITIPEHVVDKGT